jgi:regulator of protease activity HflC (stomatin/prohibitin superfamily)
MMAIFIIGVILFIVGITMTPTNEQTKRAKGAMRIIGIIIATGGVLLASVKIIPPGHVGVKVLFGKTQEGFLTEGLHIINPLLDVEEFSIRTQNYTMSSTGEEGQKMGDDAIRILSNDGLEVNIDLTILYRVNPASAPTIFKKIGTQYQNIIVRPVTRTGIRNSAAKFNAIELFAEKRAEFEQEIIANISDTLTNRGFNLEQILIRKIDLPTKVKESIERKITAIQEAERMEYVLQKEQSEAERKRVEARGISDAQKIINENLTSKLIQFETIKMQKEIATSQNSKIIIMDGKNSPPLFINDK